MKLVVLTALWRRLELSTKVMRFYSSLSIEGVRLTGVAVGSEGEASRQAARLGGFRYVHHENMPLGAKWNAGMERAADEKPDAVMIVGSDDLIEAALIKRLVERIRRGAHYAGLTDIYFLDHDTGGLGYFPGHGLHRGGDPVGAGRVFSAPALESVGWRPWSDDLKSGLDRDSHKRMRRKGVRPKMLSCKREGLIAVDVKSGENIWSWGHISKHLERTTLTAREVEGRLGVLLVRKREFVRLPDGRIAVVEDDSDPLIVRPLGRSSTGASTCPTETWPRAEVTKEISL